jgi:uncharacterized membrane protein
MDIVVSMLTIIFWVVSVIFISITIIKSKASSFDKETGDALSNEDENFKELLDGLSDKDPKFGEMMLKESRDNLDYSLSQRESLNNSNLSMTAIIIGLVTGAVYLGKYLFEIPNEKVQIFYGSLIVMIFACISVSVFLLLHSFTLKYSDPDPKNDEIRNLMAKIKDGKKNEKEGNEDEKKVIREIRNYLITLNGHKSAENYAANKKKFKLANCTRMYIFFSCVILLAMLITLGICKINVLNICGCCC